VDNRRSWDLEAANWLRWARTPGHDAYWYYRRSFFDALLPPPGRRTLELGCGEGRVVRDLSALGHRVVAVDGSPTLLGHARDSDPAGRYVLADASALPLSDDSVDLAVAYNSLMDFDDMPAALRELARVLEPGAPLCVCVVHPVFGAGGFENDDPDAVFLLPADYFGNARFDATVERDGLTMRFQGWSPTLEDYFAALRAAGFLVDLLREPVLSSPPPHLAPWRRYPMFLHLRATATGRAPLPAPARRPLDGSSPAEAAEGGGLPSGRSG